jgi:hypothetical protein
MTDVREMMTSWMGSGKAHLLAWSDRKTELVKGSARGKRYIPGFRPFDLLSGPNQEIVFLENEDNRIGVESVAGAQQDFLRYCDFDVVYFQFAGTATIETEFGVYEMAPAEIMLVPGGIAHRTTGSADCLRVFAKLHEPVLEMFDEGNQCSHTEFQVKRHGAPEWEVPADRREAPKGKVTERLITWRDGPDDVTLVDRDYEYLVGATSTSRSENISGIKKFRAFDVFTYPTGVGKGPGPKIILSKHFMAEVYNTLGNQHTFHRALRSEEIGIQFRGQADNVSEFDEKLITTPGWVGVVPLGIAHRVEDCDEDFLRVVFYSELPWRVPVDVTNHAYDSTFEIKTKIIEQASWLASAAE